MFRFLVFILSLILVSPSFAGTIKYDQQGGVSALTDIGDLGCALNEIIKWSGSAWACSGDAGGAGAGDEVLISGSGVTDALGVNFIAGTYMDINFDGVPSPETATVVFDASEVASVSWNSGSGDFSWTFNASGATDPIIDFGSNFIRFDTTPVRIGDAGTIDSATGDGDIYVEDALEVDGASSFAGTISSADINSSGDITAVNVNPTNPIADADITGSGERDEVLPWTSIIDVASYGNIDAFLDAYYTAIAPVATSDSTCSNATYPNRVKVTGNANVVWSDLQDLGDVRTFLTVFHSGSYVSDRPVVITNSCSIPVGGFVVDFSDLQVNFNCTGQTEKVALTMIGSGYMAGHPDGTDGTQGGRLSGVEIRGWPTIRFTSVCQTGWEDAGVLRVRRIPTMLDDANYSSTTTTVGVWLNGNPKTIAPNAPVRCNGPDSDNICFYEHGSFGSTIGPVISNNPLAFILDHGGAGFSMTGTGYSTPGTSTSMFGGVIGNPKAVMPVDNTCVQTGAGCTERYASGASIRIDHAIIESYDTAQLVVFSVDDIDISVHSEGAVVTGACQIMWGAGICTQDDFSVCTVDADCPGANANDCRPASANVAPSGIFRGHWDDPGQWCFGPAAMDPFTATTFTGERYIKIIGSAVDSTPSGVPIIATSANSGREIVDSASGPIPVDISGVVSPVPIEWPATYGAPFIPQTPQVTAADCTALTVGVFNQECFDTKHWRCDPDVGGASNTLCDQAADWIAFSVGPTVETAEITSSNITQVLMADDAVGEPEIDFIDGDTHTDGHCLVIRPSGTGGTIETVVCGTGTGDITDVFSCSTGDCADITLAEGDSLSFAGIDLDATNEGLILTSETTCAGAVTAGTSCYQSGDDAFCIYDGTAWDCQILGAAGGGDNVQVDGANASTTANFTSTADIDFIIDGGFTTITANVNIDVIDQDNIDTTATLTEGAGGPTWGDSSVWFSTTGLIFEGATSDLLEGLLVSADITGADKTWTLPNVTGTIITSGDTATVTEAMLGSVDSTAIADNTITTTDLNATLTFADSDFVDLGAIYNTSVTTSKGLILPDSAVCTANTAEGQVCWDNDGNFLSIGDGAGVVTFSSGGWTDVAANVSLGTSTDEVIIGGATPLSSAKLSIDGDTDQIQLIVQGNATQTANVLVIEQSDGTDLLTLDNSGNLVVKGTADYGPSATPTETFTDGDTTDDEVSARIDVNCTTTGTTVEDCDFSIGSQLNGSVAASTYYFNMDSDEDDGGAGTTNRLTIGHASVNAITITTDGTGSGEVVLPTGAIATGEILDATIAQADIDDTVAIGSDPSLGIDDVWFEELGLVFEGDAADAAEGLLTSSVATSDKTWTLPNTTGTIITSGDTATVTEAMLASEDYGDFTCSSGADDCVLDNETVDGAAVVASLDLSGKTSFAIPQAADPTVDANGEVAVDDNLWGTNNDGIVFWDGDAETAVITIPQTEVAGCSNGEVIEFVTGGTFTCAVDDSAGSPSFDTIGDAATAGAIGMVETVQSFDWVTSTNPASFDAFTFGYTLEATTGDDTLNVVVIEQQNDATDSSDDVDALLLVQNLEATNDPVHSAIQVLSTASAGIDVAFDADDAEITTALSIGPNSITTAATTIESTELDRLDGINAALVDLDDGPTWTGVHTFSAPIISGKVDRNNVAVNDNDCTGETGLWWYDTTDNRFEFCNGGDTAPPTSIKSLGLNLRGLSNEIISNSVAVILSAEGGTNNEGITFNLESVANEVGITSGTGVDTFNFINNSISVADLKTEVRSMYWGAGSISSDGTNCANPTESANILVKQYSIVCADNDASIIYGSTVMPDGWDGGTVAFTLEIFQVAASINTIEIDFAAKCVSNDEALSAFGTPPTGEQPASITLTAANDMLEDDTSAVTVDGTTCAAGDALFWTGQVDATASHADIATAVEIMGVKMEYTTNIGD